MIKTFVKRPEKNKPAYSVAMDVLLAWGRAGLLKSEEDADKSSLNKISYVVLGERESTQKVKRGIERLKKRAENALDFLNGPSLPQACYDEPQRVQSSLETLDDVALLSEAVEFSPYAKEVGENLRNAVDKLLMRATVEEAPSGLRLVPLNDWRREKLRTIPADRHFLFPWYELWSELPKDTLDRLAAAWGELEAGSGTVEGIEEGNLAAILGELERDGDLLEWIRVRAGLG